MSTIGDNKGYMTKQKAEYMKSLSKDPPGKGSRYRPVDRKKYQKNWEKIFRKTKAKAEDKPQVNADEETNRD
jgi:hypothetical protein